MKFKLLFVICLALFPAMKAQKTKSLFNGKNLKGWQVLIGDAEFKVEDGVIVGVSKATRQSTFLATKKEYTNFILEYEMMVGEGLNTGVQIRTQFDDVKKHLFGLQVEGDDSERGWTGGIYDQGRKGWRYPLTYNPNAKNVFRKGQWNRIKVVAYENHIATWLNGVHVADLLEETVETGFIALQVHSAGKDKEGVENKWRNMTITELNTAPDFSQTTAPTISYLTNKLTDAEKKDGWKLLWDGKTSQGWRGAKRDDFPEKGWSISDGILTVHASGGGESENGGDIVTTRPYKNFILELDFKFTKGANSGIKYFVDTDLNKAKGRPLDVSFKF
ncbi:3-keto-disaccharide hydrolase [Saccharicrinis fermentans]|uniref:3-keto-alpha-glucoside-1,2-lyase/3-keto-2-hydroxy-glucal hydratase domain-containing protein n=1 Tax=Saccharicrinis fermentans DSM 9555 = JCM 21142 TaxID=869213 RepID=W7Y3V4_9BACT|nr:DUF1080 domain-containing protein [Saccharicrinis fermentans]GAF02263.1 hypothetical protein JCM21142_3892 [Saccharicrinis fermentans DSM 9555 = JCM 21142]